MAIRYSLLAAGELCFSLHRVEDAILRVVRTMLDCRGIMHGRVESSQSAWIVAQTATLREESEREREREREHRESGVFFTLSTQLTFTGAVLTWFMISDF